MSARHPLARTALASALLALAAHAAASWLTHDYQVWTAEGARRLEIAQRPVPSPPIVVHGPGVGEQTLEALLSAGGTPTIVDFIYTRCVSVCSTLGSVFQQMQARIAQDREEASGRAPVRLLSIGFDPRDDSAALAARAAGLQADPALWRFAHAATAADTRLLLDRFQVTVIPDGLGGYEHNAALLVVDARGRLVRVFDYAEAETALAFAEALPLRGAVR